MTWGMLAQRNHWPPYSAVKALYDGVSPPPGGGHLRPDPALVSEVAPLDRETDPLQLVHAVDLDELDELRGEMTAFLFGEDRLPTRLPEHEARAASHPEFGSAVTRWRVETEFGIRSVVFEFGSDDAGAPTVIYHQGHGEVPAQSAAFLRRLAGAGARVFSMAMPLEGRNPPTVVELPQGRVQIGRHAHLDWLQPASGHPLRFLVEPVIVMLNELEARGSWGPIVMIGVSGGGWTTTLAAALDPRIALSVPVAGTLPLWLRFGRAEDWGDWEQNLPAFYRRFSYLDLYLMGAAHPGRLQLQVLNQFDPVCFSGVRARLYEPVIQQWLDANGGGEFRVLIDDTHADHAISAATQDILIELIPGLIEP
jgi:hypothetical protein